MWPESSDRREQIKEIVSPFNPKRDLDFKPTGSLGILHRMESLIGEDRGREKKQNKRSAEGRSGGGSFSRRGEEEMRIED